MNKIRKIIQCLKYKTVVLGKVGKGNRFERDARVESVAEIGNHNYFSFRVMIGNARIANYCSFGPDVKIGQSQHSVDYFTTSQKVSRRAIGFSMLKNKAEIGNDVWLGANVVVMQGVKIGDGAVVGANAVVTKDIPPYAIAVGIPAKVVRYRFPEETVYALKQSKWWDYDVEQACEILKNITEDPT